MVILCVLLSEEALSFSFLSVRYTQGQFEQDEINADVAAPTCEEPSMVECMDTRPPLDMPLSRRSWIDAAYSNETSWPKVRNGVKMGEGDGTVSLLSLGAMCVEGWKRKRWNPAGIKIKTVEVSSISCCRHPLSVGDKIVTVSCSFLTCR